MSFTSDIKHELCSLELDEAMKKAQLSALFLVGGNYTTRNRQQALLFETSYAFIAKHVYMLLKDFHLSPEICVVKRSNLKKNKVYQLYLYESYFGKDSPVFKKKIMKVPMRLVRSEKNARAFLQGAFLAGGSITSPKSTNYHMEICAGHQPVADQLVTIMDRFHLPVKMVMRRGKPVIYMKASEKIADFLSLIDAANALFHYEDIRIQRDFYNQFTRLDNCEVANEMKSQKAAKEQLSWIDLVERNAKTKIPEKLERVMIVRKDNPDASILELCNEIYLRYGEIISKSGMKHRLSKLKELAASLQEGANA